MALTKQQKVDLNARVMAAMKNEEEAQALLASYGDVVIRMSDPEKGYSTGNQIRIWLQARELGIVPTACAGFHDWKLFGRKVKKGGVGFFIYAGGGAAAPRTEGEEPGRRFFGGTYVYDISMTEEIAAGEADDAGDEEGEAA